MPGRLKVGIVGATGETGNSIANALLSSPEKFEVFAFARSASLGKPALLALSEQGVTLNPIDLDGALDATAKSLEGLDVVISCLTLLSYKQEIQLISAVKQAGVQRYVPSFFGPVVPPKGVFPLRDAKEGFLDHIKALQVPYTAIDIGWWYQATIPRLPHENDPAAFIQPMPIVGNGDVKMGLTDNRDIGEFVARIIADKRTLNRSVFAYSEVLSTQEAWDDFEAIYARPFDKQHVSDADLLDILSKGPSYDLTREISPADMAEVAKVAVAGYYHTLAVRGDNTPEKARTLGYLDARELYPELQTLSWKGYVRELVVGKIRAPYSERKSS